MKRIAAAVLSSLLIAGFSLSMAPAKTYALNIEGSMFQRFPKMNVSVNGKELNDQEAPNFVLENRTMVPLKPFTELLGAFTETINSKVQVTRPNVNMIVTTSIQKLNNSSLSIIPFSSVNKGQKISPIIYYVIDNVPSAVSLQYKIVILDPDNKEIYSTSPNNERKGSAWIGIEPLDEITFSQSGNYKVQFLMKVNNGDYLRIGQTLIQAN